MKILIISFYYEPDLCAGSFRTTSFVKALKAHLGHDDFIDVVTTMPNRYSTFAVDANEIENQGNVLIKRIKIPTHKSGFADQSKSFLIYLIKTLEYVIGRKYDVVFATSSRLLSAFLGAIIARQKKVPLYLDIRDIFTDTMSSVLDKSALKSVIPLFMLIEKFTMGSADKINFVSKGFIPYFQKKHSNGLKYSFFPNGIDEEFLSFHGNRSAANDKTSKVVFTYTGNIGEGQGLEKIIPQIAQKYPNVNLQVIGDGGRKKVLRESIARLPNVKLIDPVNRASLLKYYEESDFLFLQLNDYDAFKKVLPSKIFEYAATYKPIIAGVDGYARDFIEEHLPDAIVYKPCDIDDFCKKFDAFDGVVDIDNRRNFITEFSRSNIMDAMARDLLGVMRG